MSKGLGLFLILGALVSILPLGGETKTMSAAETKWPEVVGDWKAAGPPRRIDAGNIFEYMNGGGELYLAYRFDHMLAREYRDNAGNDITVEVYRMQASDDAFGLLSLDWSGEAVPLAPPPAGGAPSMAGGAAPATRALYGAGLLRLCVGELYARVMAVRETPAARQAVLELGAAVAAGRPAAEAPELLQVIPGALAGGWTLRPERTAFFRSHLVLNSLYYLSHENILALDLSCAAAFATYENPGGRFHLALLRYGDVAAAKAALRQFLRAYLSGVFDDNPGMEAEMEASLATTLAYKVEDGWLGARFVGATLALLLAGPDQETVLGVLARLFPEST